MYSRSDSGQGKSTTQRTISFSPSLFVKTQSQNLCFGMEGLEHGALDFMTGAHSFAQAIQAKFCDLARTLSVIQLGSQILRFFSFISSITDLTDSAVMLIIFPCTRNTVVEVSFSTRPHTFIPGGAPETESQLEQQTGFACFSAMAKICDVDSQ